MTPPAGRGAAATVWVVRHAEAGDRSRWEGPDPQRPLTAEGRRQAEALVAGLGGHGVRAAGGIRSSPYLRCRQTVEPLAACLGRPVVDEPALAEGAPLRALELLPGWAGQVLSVHGDLVKALLDLLRRDGLVDPLERRAEKGGTWVLQLEGAGPVGAEYLPAPVVG